MNVVVFLSLFFPAVSTDRIGVHGPAKVHDTVKGYSILAGERCRNTERIQMT